MSRAFILLITFLFTTVSFAQTTYTWVGGANGNYQLSSNWLPVRSSIATNDILAFDAASPVIVANVPNQTIGAVRILSGTSSVTFTTNVTTNVLSLSASIPLIYTTAGSILAGDLLTVSLTNAAAFSITSGTFGIAPSTGGKISINSALILTGGALDFDVVGTGGTTINSGGSITYSSGLFNCFNEAAITFANGSNYYHAASGAGSSAIPAAIWAGTSVCNIIGMNAGTVAPTGFTGVTFANLNWNCSSQIGNVDLDFLGNPVNIKGTFTVTNTGTGAVRLIGTGAASINTGAYSQTGGSLVLQASTGNTILAVSGNFSHTGGTIDFAGSGTSPGTATLDVKGSLTKGVGTIWSSTSTNTASQMIIQFSGISSQVISIGGTWNAPGAGRCNIVNSNTDAVGVSLNSSGVAGSLRVTNINCAAAATCTNSGNFTGVGVITYFGSGAGNNNLTLIYNGSSPQTASSVEFPSLANIPYNLTINSTVGVVFPASFSRTIPGTLRMTSGGISLGTANTLSLTNASLSTQLIYTSGFITSGMLSRRFPTTGLPTDASTSNSLFPFGSGANDRSINIFFSSSNVAGGAGGDIAISHSAIVNTSTIASPFLDNGVTLDKRTNSKWDFNTGGFNLGSGGTTISITAQTTNIGSVDNLANLRLTDATAGFGSLIATSGTNDAPLVGKSDLVLSDINSKTYYVGSDVTNALQIVTFTWTGATNTNWTTTGNWTGGVGYPSSPTEIAIINTVGGNMPVINSAQSINVYQLAVGSSASLTMNGTARINVYDNVTFTGTAIFASTSTFTYASSVNAQIILDLPYGNLGVSGSAAKTPPATTTVTGDFTISGVAPDFKTGNTTFIYAPGSAAIQRVAATDYYNLTFMGNRSGNTIRLGNGVTFNTIRVYGAFNMAATNYTAVYDPVNTFDFSSSGPQTIPGFTYGGIKNTGTGIRTWDNQGSADPSHVINCKSFSGASPLTNNVTTGSKIRLDRSSSTVSAIFGFPFYDFEITGNLGGTDLYIVSGQAISIAGTFKVSATNFKQPSTVHTFIFNGTGAQTIPAFKTNAASNTPAWKFNNVTVSNGNRVITLGGGGTDTINITGTLTVPPPASFSAGTGFVVAGSTVNYINSSGAITALTPATIGGNNYNNIIISGGTRSLSNDLLIGGNVSLIDSDTSSTTLNVGDFTNDRTLTILGNLSLNGTSALATTPNTVIDFNAGSKNSTIKLTGNLSVAGKSQLTTTNGSTVKGTILFNGTTQQYNNTASFKNGFVNFVDGDGTNPTSLTLNNNFDLIRSGVTPFSSSLTVANNAILDVNTKNINIGTDDNNIGNNAIFNLNAGATLVTANTGIAPNTAIEGTATDGTTGTVLAGANITKNYSIAANYELNGATVNPFPAAISTMNNLTLGANVSLNKPIDVNGILDLASFVITQDKNDLEFSGLKSTIGSIYADKMSILTINGSIGTIDTLRFAPGGNSTGQFTINRPITVPLGANLTIDNSPLSGNFITGTPSSILDINGNTLTINGTISGVGFLSGSNTSNLTLGGAAVGTLNFISGKQVLKNLTLVNNATASLGTALDITGGTGPGTEGTVSITGSAILTSGGNLSLKSTANGTARVATGSGSGGYIIGDVTVERFLSNHRSWRFLAAPTYGQTIKQSWQENQPAGVNPGAGLGTNITSNRATWLSDGFDFQTPGNSLLIYNPATNIWDGATSTNVPISGAAANKSYMLFLRGDRSATPAAGAPAITTTVMRTKGILFQGNLPPVIVNPGQYASIGNNYASAIDFTLLSKSNVDQSFSLWDPYVPGANNLGAWVTFSAATGWLPSISGVSYSGANTRIESGQAFMVHNSSDIIGGITFNESDKISGSKLVSRPAGNNGATQMLITNLYNTAGGVANITDGNFVVFSEDYSNAIDKWDAVKLNNFGDNFGISRDGQMLVVDARQPVAETDTIFFNMKKVRQQSYRLELFANNFDVSLIGFLEDMYLHNTTAVNMGGTTYYDFTINGEAASASANRFRIVFKNATPLPVTFSIIAAIEKINGISVQWKVENEINIASYDVERSADGRNFTKMNNTLATGQNTGGSAGYNWLDLKAMTGDNFYRIRSISRDGKTAYSRIVKVTLEKGNAEFTVYPNPIADGMIGLQMKNIPAGIYTVRILNSDGQLISKEIINHTGGDGTKTITSAKQLASGSYQLEITDADNKLNTIRILVL